MSIWHQLSTTETLRILDSRLKYGLRLEQVHRRHREYGPNRLVESVGRKPWLILWEQLSSAMVVLLIGAAIISGVLHEYADTLVILVIVLINAALGFFQDYRAERALAALKQLTQPTVRVRRDGVLSEIPADELVPGDLIPLEAGNFVPADCRLLEVASLQIQEAALTGESEPISKQVEAVEAEIAPLGDRRDMAYMGTMVTYGRAWAAVVATGMQTELGAIAGSLHSVKPEPTPLQQKLGRLGRTLAIMAIGIVVLVFLLGILRGEDPKLMLLTALSLAVAVVPEGLPAIATMTLALGARRMFRRQALIRKLPAVETLGSVDIICSDKTGTLTENRMQATTVALDGKLKQLDEFDSSITSQSLTLLMLGASLCNDAELEVEEENHAVGDPTEVALAAGAAHLGFTASQLLDLLPRVAEFPFDSQRKRMTTIHQIHSQETGSESERRLGPLSEMDGDLVAFTKGAVDALTDVCEYIWKEEGPGVLDERARDQLESVHDELTGSGMRVLGVAFRLLDPDPHPDPEAAEDQLIFIGMFGLIDPPRPEAHDAVTRCKSAGIRPIMITGDHPRTAQSVAKELGIDDSRIVKGSELEDCSEQDIAQLAETVSVYARVAPRHKLELVKALQARDHVVAMTGDGVNDAPALKQAHIGVAMGITGTDVSKEASQMVLLDDNFATIVNAVEQGRVVYDNIRKFIKYTMTSNAGEIWVMLLGPFLGLPLPLLPLQILWVNLVTDGLPGLAFALEPAERNTMRRVPRSINESIFNREMVYDIGWIGILMGTISLLGAYWFMQLQDLQPERWRSMVFTTLTLAQMGNALAIRSDRDSLFSLGLFSNPLLLIAVLLTIGLQLSILYVAPLRALFHTAPMTGAELISCIVLSSTVFWAVEAKKWLQRSKWSRG